MDFFLTQHKCAVGASISYLKINMLLQGFPYLVDGVGSPELAKNFLIPPSTRENPPPPVESSTKGFISVRNNNFHVIYNPIKT